MEIKKVVIDPNNEDSPNTGIKSIIGVIVLGVVILFGLKFKKTSKLYQI